MQLIFIFYFTFLAEDILGKLIDGDMLFEDDVKPLRNRRSVLLENQFYWPGAIVPYEFDKVFPISKYIVATFHIIILWKNTCKYRVTENVGISILIFLLKIVVSFIRRPEFANHQVNFPPNWNSHQLYLETF